MKDFLSLPALISSRWQFIARAIAVFALTASASAEGLYEDGAGPRAQAMGGAGAAVADDPLSALFNDPAALTDLTRPSLQIGPMLGAEESSFHNVANSHVTSNTVGGIGDVAATYSFGSIRLALGLNHDIALTDNWHYVDAPGGADGATSYGYHDNNSQILLLRSGFGGAWEVTRNFSVGATVGLLYNENQLQTSYVFQSQPVLRGVKTRLDLQTDGYGYDADLGLRWRPIPTVAVSVAYTTRARVESYGRANGDAHRQLVNLGLGAARSTFAYDAKVTNIFPQQVNAGVSWNPIPSLTIAGEVDWINWSDAFQTLRVRLTNGTDPALNGLVNSTGLRDNVPLNWHDQYVGRIGLEKTFGAHWSLRAGYAYGNDPVPPGTLTPLTAAITEHLVTVGAGYEKGAWRFDGSFQWEIPATGRVRQSQLADGEYSNSVTTVTVEWVGLTARYEFGPRSVPPTSPKDFGKNGGK